MFVVGVLMVLCCLIYLGAVFWFGCLRCALVLYFVFDCVLGVYFC